MNRLFKKHWPIILILAVSLITHFAFFGYPKETVFDEVHFGKFISGYFTREYFFDIHPPLGKLLISGIGYITGFEPGFSFGQIGEQFPDNHYLWLRLLPMLAGTLLPLMLFFLALRLGLSRPAAITIGLLTALENSLIVQSRFILLDAFLLLFGFLALLFYFRHRQQDHPVNLFAAGLFAGLSISVKWTGGTFLAIILILFIFNINFKESGRMVWKQLVRSGLLLFALPIIVYFSIFIIHLNLLDKSGPGDAFMTPAFRKTLIGSVDAGNSDLKPKSLPMKIIELNNQMYASNARLTATHSYSSKWYTWPFMQRPIYYWHGSTPLTTGGSTPLTTGGSTPLTTGGSTPDNSSAVAKQANLPQVVRLRSPQVQTDSRIYFLGNPAIWLFSTLSIFYLLLTSPSWLQDRKKRHLPLLLIGAYLLNLLPFIGISRAMFLYHYMIAYIFAIFALVYLIDQLDSFDKLKITKKTVFTGLIIVSVASFIYFAPLTYGTPLTAKAYNLRAWLPSWR